VIRLPLDARHEHVVRVLDPGSVAAIKLAFFQEPEFPLVDLTVNGRPARFLVDTGSNAVVLFDDALGQLGLQTDGQFDVAVDSYDSRKTPGRSYVKSVAFSIGKGTSLRIENVFVFPPLIPSCQGILGSMFLYAIGASLDFRDGILHIAGHSQNPARQEMAARPDDSAARSDLSSRPPLGQESASQEPGASQPSLIQEYTVTGFGHAAAVKWLPFEKVCGVPIVELTVNGQPARFLVDTGSNATGFLADEVEKLGLRTDGKFDSEFHTATEQGAMSFPYIKSVILNIGNGTSLRVDNAVVRPANGRKPHQGFLDPAFLTAIGATLDFRDCTLRIEGEPNEKEPGSAAGPCKPDVKPTTEIPSPPEQEPGAK
jgi:hypothetical protein